MQSFFDTVFQFIRMIQINDIIDILVVSFVFYKAMMLLRETRGEQLVRGIISLFIIMQFSDWLSLNTLYFLLRNTMQVGLLAIIVVFQPELRRALEKMGNTSLKTLTGQENEELQKTVDTIASTCARFSRDRVGALIVFERFTRLGDIIRTGTVLDADISEDLLVTIFNTNIPLHDGAVVIRDNRIHAASCFLPLTTNENLSRELGTRHRSAIGITECSDAVVVVVSEETGKISFGKDGNLTRNLSEETLKKALMKSLENAGPQKKDGIFAAVGNIFTKWKEAHSHDKKEESDE